jgi:hypothetical protein
MWLAILIGAAIANALTNMHLIREIRKRKW